MGLDMYLYAKRKNSKDESDKNTIDLAYWRKVNSVHNWFVENVQDGVDDCNDYIVSKDKIEELLEVCKTILNKEYEYEIKQETYNAFERNKETGEMEVIEKPIDVKHIKNTEEIEKLLPTVGGFFFGSTDYDEYYLEDIKDTQEMLEKTLNTVNFDEYDVYYGAWW